MKKIIFILLALYSTTLLYGRTSDQPTIWVWVEGSSESIRHELNIAMMQALIGRFTVVDRSHEFLRALAEQQRHTETGLIPTDQIVELARQRDGDYVSIITVGELGSISVRIVEATGAARAAFPVEIRAPLENFAERQRISAEISRQLDALSPQQSVDDRRRTELRRAVDRGYVSVGETLWVATANSTRNVTYRAAQDACRSYRGGGHEDWRLPTLSEANRMHTTMNEFIQLGLSSAVPDPARELWTSTPEGSDRFTTVRFQRSTNELFPFVSSGSAGAYELRDVRCVRGR